MARYNVFYLIHKGLRAMLYDAALTLQQTDFLNLTEAAIALEKVDDVLHAFDGHAAHEDCFIIPLVEVFEPETAALFEQEHVEDHRLSNVLKNLLAIYENVYFSEERTVCGSAISKAFVEFMVFNLGHMAKEEEVLNIALWKHYTDEQIVAKHRQLLAAVPPEEMRAASKWMMRGINNADITGWLRNVKHTAPGFIYKDLLEIAADELSELRFSIVQDALEDKAMV